MLKTRQIKAKAAGLLGSKNALVWDNYRAWISARFAENHTLERIVRSSSPVRISFGRSKCWPELSNRVFWPAFVLSWLTRPATTALTQQPLSTIVSPPDGAFAGLAFPVTISMTNPFDAGIVSFLNHFARRSYAFDMFFVLCSNYLLRVAGIVPLYWWAWFREGEGKTGKRDILTFGLISCLFTLLLSRTLSLILPFRARPFLNPDLHFQVPYGQSTQMLIGWSSFPSDHAAVYFTLAICLFFVSRRLGIFALCWAFFVTSLPRIYLGLHYPTDVIGGTLLAVGVAFLSKNSAIRTGVTGRVLKWNERHPGPFYAVVFLYGVQLATAFESVLVVKDYIKAVTTHAARLLH